MFMEFGSEGLGLYWLTLNPQPTVVFGGRGMHGVVREIWP